MDIILETLGETEWGIIAIGILLLIAILVEIL